MRPFFPPRPNPNPNPNPNQPTNPNPSPLPPVPTHHLNPAFPPPIPNPMAATFAANPMVAAAAANPFLALQLLGQAQQLQNLGFLAAAALQQQQQFVPGGFAPTPNQFSALGAPRAGLNGGPVFQPGARLAGCNGGVGTGGSRPRPTPTPAPKDANGCGSGGMLNHNHTENRKNDASHFASEKGGRNFAMNQNGRFHHGRDGKNSRPFDRSGGRGNMRPFNQGRGRGGSNNLRGKSNFASDCNPKSEVRRRCAPIIYDAKEVKQWREARKKNYPTRANVNMKLAQRKSSGQNKDEEAQMRRQQLKEVLAKQQELGFELPELPPGYLSDKEGQANQRKSNWKTDHRGGRFQNHFNNKRLRYDRRDFRSKRPRLQNDTPGDDAAMVKSREPTLLQKLLSSDIKRDRHRLLHAFKFMILNNFFKEWPEKPLEFPTVTVNQIEFDCNIGLEGLEDMPNPETEGNSIVVKEACHEKGSCSTDEENECNDDSGNEEDDNASTESTDDDENGDDNAEQGIESEEDIHPQV